MEGKILENRFIVGKILGRGSQGVVIVVTDNTNNQKYLTIYFLKFK